MTVKERSITLLFNVIPISTKWHPSLSHPSLPDPSCSAAAIAVAVDTTRLALVRALGDSVSARQPVEWKPEMTNKLIMLIMDNIGSTLQLSIVSMVICIADMVNLSVQNILQSCLIVLTVVVVTIIMIVIGCLDAVHWQICVISRFCIRAHLVLAREASSNRLR